MALGPFLLSLHTQSDYNNGISFSTYSQLTMHILNQWASFNINKEVKFETGSSENTSMKSMLTVVLDLNGLLTPF